MTTVEFVLLLFMNGSELKEYTVRDENQEIQSVEYGHMVSLCIKAIQELSDKVTALENK